MPEQKQILSKEEEKAFDFLVNATKEYPFGTPFGLNKLPYVLRDAVAKVMVEYAASQQSEGLRWVKASERLPNNRIIDVYHVKVKYLDLDDSVLMPSSCTFSGEWEVTPNIEVVEWLDESSPVEQVDDKFEFVEWIRKNDWQPFFDSKWVNKNSIGVEYKTTDELYSLFLQSKTVNK